MHSVKVPLRDLIVGVRCALSWRPRNSYLNTRDCVWGHKNVASYMKNPHFFSCRKCKDTLQRYFSTQELYRVSRYSLWRRETCLECVVGHFREFELKKEERTLKSLFTHTIPCRAPAAAVSFVKVRVLPERSELPIAKLRFVAGRNRTWADRPPAVERRAMIVHTYTAVPMPCCAVALRSLLQSGMVGARQGHGVISVN